MNDQIESNANENAQGQTASAQNENTQASTQSQAASRPQRNIQPIHAAQPAVNGPVLLVGSWPEFTVLMHGMVDGKIVTRNPSEGDPLAQSLTFNFGNGTASYKIIEENEDEMTLELLPGWTLQPQEKPQETAGAGQADAAQADEGNEQSATAHDPKAPAPNVDASHTDVAPRERDRPEPARTVDHSGKVIA